MTLLFYIVILSLTLFFVRASKYNKYSIYFAYSIILLISVLRFDIGNDYNFYMKWISADALKYSTYKDFFDTNFLTKEITYYLLTYVFKGFEYPYVPVLAVYFLASLVLLYKTFSYRDNHFYGILLLFISGFAFILWDQVRQGLAICIFLYSIKYIEDRNFLKYLLCVICASFIHYSAIVLLPIYLVRHVKPRKIIYTTIILILAMTNLPYISFSWIAENVLNTFFLYELHEHTLLQITTIGYRIRIFVYALIWIYIINKMPDKDYILTNVIFIGAVIFIFASGALNVMRIGFYFTNVIVIALPILLNKKPKKSWAVLALLALTAIFLHDVATNTNTRGAVPYDTILFKNLKIPQLR